MPSDPLANLTSRLLSTERARIRIEQLHATGNVARRDAERLHEGLFIRAVTTLEAFFEELFVLIVLGKTSHPQARAYPRADFRSRAVLKQFMKGDSPREFIDWLPYRAVEDRA